MDENIFRLILLAIPLMGCVITVYIVPILKEKFKQVQLGNIKDWIEFAVFAAEALFKAPGSGDEKREYVIKFINQMFNKDSEHIVITEEQIRIILESIWEQFLKTK